jgi:hypothetical protein
LGFEETPSSKNTSRPASIASTHSRSTSQPITVRQTSTPKRSRAPSDPFLDSHSPSAPLVQAPSPRLATSPTRGDVQLDDFEQEFLRVWTAPDLDNNEYTALLNVFPSFITKRAFPRFPLQSSQKHDLEVGQDDNDESYISFGTGTMWISPKPRQDGWSGSWWTRFILWLKRIFS